MFAGFDPILIAMIGLVISGLNFVLTWGVGFYVHITSRNKATNDRIKGLEEGIDSRLDGQGERIARLEERVHSAPTHHDLGELYKKVNKTAEDVGHIAGEMKGINDNLRLILNQIAQRGMK